MDKSILETIKVEDVLDLIYDFISIVDKDGYLLFCNKACNRLLTGISIEEMIGKHMNELVEMGVMDQSISLKCIEEKPTTGFGRIARDGYEDRLNWVCPHFDEAGELDYVVNTEWNLEALLKMKEFYTYIESINGEIQNELVYLRKKNVLLDKIIYKSSKMKKILLEVSRIAHSDANVLISGETGTGKELMMKYIVSRSLRAQGPLIEINCGAMPENLIESELFGYEKGAFTGANASGKKGLFELANKGTLFLDEIGELPYQLQAKLLRVLQEGQMMRIGGTKVIPIDVRIIAATNVDLQAEVKAKRFRADLFFRLNVVPVEIPPLRERIEDIEPLLDYFRDKFQLKYRKKLSFSEKAKDALKKYQWPGNVREMRNLIERLFIIESKGEISTATIMSYLYRDVCAVNESESADEFTSNLIPQGFDYFESLETYEKNLLQSNINRFSSIRKYADFLGMTRSTLERKLKKYNLKIGKGDTNE